MKTRRTTDRRGFTLIELLIVVAIMGMMGTVSIGAYRSMRQGMEERGVMQSASQFVRLAYQRAKIDNRPVNVYFWNETLKAETDEDQAVVVGRAVAVRQGGRLTSVTGDGLLVDEFGDLEAYRYTNEEGEEDPNSTEHQNAPATYLYRINGTESRKEYSLVSPTTVPVEMDLRFISYPEAASSPGSGSGSGGSGGGLARMTCYGYYVRGGMSASEWKPGDAYGVEFADLTLPAGYIFKTNYKTDMADPVAEIGVFNFNPVSGNDGGGQTIAVSALRPGKDGRIAAKEVESTVAPGSSQSQQ